VGTTFVIVLPAASTAETRDQLAERRRISG
jgi:hypothetical protein